MAICQPATAGPRVEVVDTAARQAGTVRPTRARPAGWLTCGLTCGLVSWPTLLLTFQQVVVLLLLIGPARAAEPAPSDGTPAGPPSFARLESAGARIGTVRIRPRNVFDTEDPAEDRALFRLANTLHIVTREEVIERSVLFAPGQPVSVQRIEETERLLRANRFLYDAQVLPVATRDGVVDIEVLTRDTWSLQPGLSLGRAGGANQGSIRLREYNLLGTGLALDLSRQSTVDREETVFAVSGAGLLGDDVGLDIGSAQASDGRRRSVVVARPFKALDSRWAAGASFHDDDRVDDVYRGGQVASSLRRRERRATVHAGWSAGLVDGWVHRHTVGVDVLDDTHAAEPGLVAPPVLPADQRLVLPYVGVEILQDRYERQVNRDLVGKPEDIALGLHMRVRLGRASPRTGSSRAATQFGFELQRGFAPKAADLVLASARLTGEYSQSQRRRQHAMLDLRGYRAIGPRTWLYAAARLERLTRPDPTVALTLGGDNGLRGYPLRFQSGDRRALLTLEARHDTGLYLWRLFRVATAAYADVGRSWGGTGSGARAPWLAGVGVGLRIVNVRAAFGNVLHVDIASPLDAPAGVRRVQFLIETRARF